MKKKLCSFLGLLFVLGILLPGRLAASVEYAAHIPQLAFAGQELKDAVDDWKAYAAILSSQYKTSLLARTHFLDWNSTLKEVEKEVITVRNEGDFPKVRFTNLTDGARLPVGTDLRVEVEATDRHGIKKVKLNLNGLILKAEEKTTNPYVWSSSSDELLKSVKLGMYNLQVLVEDKTGVRSQQEIQIAVGNVSQNGVANWRDEIHQVILNDGERLMPGDVRKFPRLECFITMNDEGSLLLLRGTPGKSEGLIWKTRGKADRPTPQAVRPRFYSVLENGQLVIYRGTTNIPKLKIYETRSASEAGLYKLGITASKRLVVYRQIEDKERENIWMSPAQN